MILLDIVVLLRHAIDVLNTRGLQEVMTITHIFTCTPFTQPTAYAHEYREATNNVLSATVPLSTLELVKLVCKAQEFRELGDLFISRIVYAILNKNLKKKTRASVWNSH